jgi:hypothetical protein
MGGVPSATIAYAHIPWRTPGPNVPEPSYFLQKLLTGTTPLVQPTYIKSLIVSPHTVVWIQYSNGNKVRYMSGGATAGTLTFELSGTQSVANISIGPYT